MTPDQQLDFLQAPEEVRKLGTPDRVVMLSEYGSLATVFARTLTDGAMTGSVAAGGVAIIVTGLAIFAAGHRNAPPFPIIASGYVLAAILAVTSIVLFRKSTRTIDLKNVKFAYAFFAEALAYCNQGRWEILPWHDFVEYRKPTIASPGGFAIMRDGSQLTLHRGAGLASEGVLNEVAERVARVHGNGVIAPPMNRDPQRNWKRAFAYGLPILIGSYFALYGKGSVTIGSNMNLEVVGYIAVTCGLIMWVADWLGYSFFPNDT